LASQSTQTLTQNRTRLARRSLASRGLSEAITWSFVLKDHAESFGGGQDNLALDNPISNDLNWMRPSAMIHLLLAGQRSANQGYPGAALFELGPIFQGIAALKVMGANTDNLLVMEAVGPYWHPGRSASLRLGPKNVLASFGELHPRALKALGIEVRVVGFEIAPDNLPAPRKKSASKAKKALTLSDLMPVHRDFAFIVDEAVKAGDIVRAAKGADKQLISDVSLFDVYRGKGVDEGQKSLAIDVTLMPKEATLTDADIEAVSAKIVEKVMKAGGRLRG